MKYDLEKQDPRVNLLNTLAPFELELLLRKGLQYIPLNINYFIRALQYAL